ncbi:MAG: FAD binding domain-containing protein [Bacillota bacterium]
MIPFDLEYYAPESTKEAVLIYAELADSGKEPVYYAGGTEIVTFCRQQKIKPGALIDLKEIEETVTLGFDGEKLILGANTTLTSLSEQDYFPLLANVARGVADRTTRNRLTLGGNICGRLPYREAILPLLTAGAEVVLADGEGHRTEPLSELFDKRLRLEKGEILVQLVVAMQELGNNSWVRRRVRHGPVDYPLCHMVGVEKENYIAVAVSGLCAFPFRSEEIEKVINDTDLSAQEKVEKSTALLPGAVRSDELGSDDYRLALWQKDLAEMLDYVEGI